MEIKFLEYIFWSFFFIFENDLKFSRNLKSSGLDVSKEWSRKIWSYQEKLQ